MPPKGHALLSASSSHRWLNCPPSARLCENYDDKGSDFAAEGTDAHALCEFRLQEALGIEAVNPIENLTWYNEDMENCAASYASYIMEIVQRLKDSNADPVVLIEQHLDYSKFVREGFGTGDCIIIADGELHIIDYKHGRGVLVEAENNPQMQLYALGAMEIFDGIYDIDTVVMTIFQPRRENVSSFSLSKDELYAWAENTLKPIAELAYNGDGQYNCGEWCQFCKAKTDCRKRAETNMSIAKYDFMDPPLLTDEEIEDVLSKVDNLVSWANDVKEFAFQAAMSGKVWKGWKLVEGRAVRKYVNDDAVAVAVLEAGYDPYEKKLLGLTEMQKRLGKAKFEELLGSLIHRPQGKPTLVPESDKRPAITTAKADFIED